MKVINFLAQSGITYNTIEHLLEEGLLYQDNNGNMVFKNYSANCAEIRTTKEDPPKSYHPITPRESAGEVPGKRKTHTYKAQRENLGGRFAEYERT